MNTDLTPWKKWYKENQQKILNDYFTFLKFKTIATDSAYHAECKKCAEWLVSHLKNIGFEQVNLWPTSGQPIVFAQNTKGGKTRPTLLIYHHYDVQPVDPLNLWKSDPFQPEVRNGKVFARGAQDNKGQCFYSLTAIHAFFALSKQMNFNLKIFIEGEEESGSRGTSSALESHKEALKADHLLVIDSGIPGPNIPAIVLGIRGILTMEIRCIGANIDLHSGTFGGGAYNPCKALVRALSTLWDEKGKIAIPHFYDDVVELSKEDQALFDFSLDPSMLQQKFGIRALDPEKGYSVGQSVSVRPTLEINGINGGYTGEGFKTVLPAQAIAKVSCRLVPNQDPQKIFSQLKNSLEKHMPKGMEIEVHLDQGTRSFRSSPHSTIAKTAAKAYEEILGKPCKYLLMGGSIPIIYQLAHLTGAETVCIGYGLDDDNIHAPNECFGLDRFEQGFLTVGRILSRLNE